MLVIKKFFRPKFSASRRRTGGYSVRKFFTGFAVAVFMACTLMVTKATSNVSTPAMTNTHHSSEILAVVAPLIPGVDANQQATGNANGKTQNIDNCIALVLLQMTDSDFEIILYH